MQKRLGLVKHFLRVATPAIATLIAYMPAQAATLASSEAKFQLQNFSINPESISTNAGTFTESISPSGTGGATADANATAKFLPVFDNPGQTSAKNTSFSRATGQRADDVAVAESTAGVIGYNFLVPKGGTLSFDFSGFLKLLTSIDNPKESAVSEGLVSLMLSDEKDNSLLDSISLEGKIATPNNGDFITYKNAGNFSIANALTQNSFGGDKEFAQTDVSGRYSRIFASETSLRLVEFKSNRAAVAVPENTNSTVFLIAGGVMLMVTKIKHRPTTNNL